MATGNNFSKSTKDSEEVFDICFSPCAENGLIKEGKKSCVDCGSYLCETCLQYHKQFPALRSHQIADISIDGSGPKVTGAFTKRCSIHKGHVVDRYCADHDEICCEACVTIKHRSCKKVDSLASVAKGIRDSKEHEDTKIGLNDIVKTIKQEKDQKRKTLSSLNEKKDSTLKDIDKFEDKLVGRIKELAEISRQEVICRHAEQVETIQLDIKELETVLSVSEDSANKVSTSGLKEEQVFVNVQNGKKVVKDVGGIVEELSNNTKLKEFNYCLDQELSDRGFGMKSLGDFKDEPEGYLPYTATKYKSTDVRSGEVAGICILENGNCAFTDFVNKTLTRLNSSYAIMDKIEVSGYPVSLCTTGPREVAVALREQKTIQFVTCDKKLLLGDSFTTKQTCAGVCYDFTCDHLYVSLGVKWKGDTTACLSVFQKNGTLLKTYEIYESGTQIFSSPNNIVVKSNAIYIADRENGLIAINKDGKKQWTFTDDKLKDPWGICLLSDGLLVTGYVSNNILQVSAEGKEICELLGHSVKIINPFTLAFDKRNSRVLVGSQSKIHVYTLSKQT